MNSYSKFELVITESKKAGSQCTSRTQKQKNKICLKLAKKDVRKEMNDLVLVVIVNSIVFIKKVV